MNKRYWSDTLKKLIPYTPGEQPKDIKIIKLNTNENPYPPSPKVIEAIKACTNSELRLYPDSNCESIRKVIADYKGIKASQVFVGNGSDEILAFAFLAFLGHGKKILFPDITYSFYSVYADIFNLDYNCVPLNDDFSIPVDMFLCVNGGIVLCNPNAPTGKFLPLKDIRRILDYNSENVVIIDEAYIDFGGESAVKLLQEYPNLLVVQTLSKSRSLAGLRVGFAMGHGDLILGLETVKNSINSYTIDRLALYGSCAAINDKEYFEVTRKKVINTRDWLTLELIKLGFNVIDSKANFLLVNHPSKDAEDIYDYLKTHGILVRHFKKPRIDNYLRISIGTDDEMQVFLSTITEFSRY